MLRISQAACRGASVFFRVCTGCTPVFGSGGRRVCSLLLTSAVWCISKRGRAGLCTPRLLAAGNRLLPGETLRARLYVMFIIGHRTLLRTQTPKDRLQHRLTGFQFDCWTA